MLAPRQVFLLAEMGIPVWEMRPTPIALNAADSATTTADLVDHDALLAKLSFANWLICIDKPLTQPTQRLLQSICHALGIDNTAICVLAPSDLDAFELITLPNAEKKMLLTFGESIAQQLLGASITVDQCHGNAQFAFKSTLPMSVNPSLDSLLDQPERKKQTWRNLQHVAALIH